MNEKDADILIIRNFGQDKTAAEKDVEQNSKLLNELKKLGILDFKASLSRKCDFCDRILNEGDKFITIGDLDKCEKCQEAKNEFD